MTTTDLTPTAALSGLTGESISEAWGLLYEDGLIYRVDWELLARHFLSVFFGKKAFGLPFSELHAAYLTLPHAPKTIPTRYRGRSPKNALETSKAPVPDDARSFGRFVGQYFFDLKELPGDALLDLYHEASEDLAQIQRNITECRRRIKEQGGTPEPKAPGDNDSSEEAPDVSEKHSWAQVYQYYLEMNRTAQDEIVRFLREDIRHAAMRRASNSPFALYLSVFGQYPYRNAPHYYHPDDFSDITNKLHHLPIEDFRNWKDLYHSHEGAFFEQLESFLVATGPISQLRDAVKRHHRLNAREKILAATFAAYEAKAWEVFATLAVVQIEGLFLDYCADLGIGQEELARSSLPSKMRAIRREKGQFFDYPYYAFRLPIIRNALAHGRGIDGDPTRRAHLLLLDLLAVARLVEETELLVNQCVSIVSSSSRPASGFYATHDVVLACALRKLGASPPPFYGLDTTYAELLKRQDESAIRTFLESLASSVVELDAESPDESGQELLSVLKSVIISMKTHSQVKPEWDSLLRSSPLLGVKEGTAQLTRHNWPAFRKWVESHTDAK